MKPSVNDLPYPNMPTTLQGQLNKLADIIGIRRIPNYRGWRNRTTSHVLCDSLPPSEPATKTQSNESNTFR